MDFIDCVDWPPVAKHFHWISRQMQTSTQLNRLNFTLGSSADIQKIETISNKKLQQMV